MIRVAANHCDLLLFIGVKLVITVTANHSASGTQWVLGQNGIYSKCRPVWSGTPDPESKEIPQLKAKHTCLVDSGGQNSYQSNSKPHAAIYTIIASDKSSKPRPLQVSHWMLGKWLAGQEQNCAVSPVGCDSCTVVSAYLSDSLAHPQTRLRQCKDPHCNDSTWFSVAYRGKFLLQSAKKLECQWADRVWMWPVLCFLFFNFLWSKEIVNWPQR